MHRTPVEDEIDPEFEPVDQIIGKAKDKPNGKRAKRGSALPKELRQVEAFVEKMEETHIDLKKQVQTTLADFRTAEDQKHKDLIKLRQFLNMDLLAERNLDLRNIPADRAAFYRSMGFRVKDGK